MLTLFLVMITGGFFGRVLLKNIRLNLSSPIMATICLLVAVLGYTIGANPEVTNALPRLGLHAVLLGITGTAGAIIGTIAIEKCHFGKKKKREI